MRLTFKYIISNSSDKPFGPISLDDLLGQFDREQQVVTIAADGYVLTKGPDMVPWELILRKTVQLASDCGIPDHLVHVYKEVDDVTKEESTDPPAPVRDPAMIVYPAPTDPEK